MTDYQLTLTVKNNRLLSHMKARGIESVAELARQTGLSHSTLCQCATLKLSLYTTEDDVRTIYIRLADFFQCLPTDLVPPRQHRAGLPANRISIESNAIEVDNSILAQLPAPGDIEQDVMNRERAKLLMDALTQREYDVCYDRFYNGLTYEEIGKKQKVTRCRIRMIESQAIRKMRKKAVHLGYHLDNAI